MSSEVRKSQEDQQNGLSPAKMPKLDDDTPELSKEARIAKMRDFFSKGIAPPPGGRPMPPVKPKPKPQKKPPVVAPRDKDNGLSPTRSPPVSPPAIASPVSLSSPRSESSEEPEDPGPIKLNLESLRQLHAVVDFDFDAVARSQMLDTTPQKDRAALSQSKGLQNRRLPSNLQAKVPEDYQERRRAQSVNVRARQPMKAVQRSFEETDIGSLKEEEEISEEERRRKIMMKAGIGGQSNPLAALGNILRKGSGKKSPGKKPPAASPFKSPRDSPTSSRKLSDNPKFSDPSSTPPKSPKGFRFGIKRSSSRSKKSKLVEGGSGLDDDLKSETSSVNSLSMHSSMREELEVMETEPPRGPSPLQKVEYAKKKTGDSSEVKLSLSGASSPSHSKLDTSTASGRGGGERDSTCFKETSYEPLFGDTSSLFGTGELDAILGKKKEKTPERTLEKEEEEEEEGKKEREEEEKEKKREEREKERQEREKKEKEREEREKARELARRISIEEEQKAKKDSEKREKKRSDIRSRLQLYESHSKLSEDSDPTSSSSDQPLSSSTPKKGPEPKAKRGLFDTEDDDFLSTKTQKEEEEEKKSKTDTDKIKAKIFEDELFQSDVRPPKPARSKLRSPKREPPSPSKTTTEEKLPKKEPSPTPLSPKAASPEAMDLGVTTEEKSSVSDPLGGMEVEVSAAPALKSGAKVDDFPKKGSLTDILDYDESPLNARRVEDSKTREDKSEVKSPAREATTPRVNLFGEPIPDTESGVKAKQFSPEPVEATSDPLGAAKTEVEKESEEREKKKAADREEKKKEIDVLFGEDEVDSTPAKASTKDEGEKKKEEEEETKEKAALKVEEKPEGKKSPASRRRRDLKSTETSAAKGKTESKVSSVRSKFDSGNSKSSPRMGVKLRSTESFERKTPRAASKDSDTGGKPSWMLEIQKKKEERKKSQSESKEKEPEKPEKPATTATTTASTTTTTATKKTSISSKDISDDNLPDWRQKMRDRRKHRDALRAEASSTTSSQAEKSPRLSRRTSDDAAGSKSPGSEKRLSKDSIEVGSKSPRTRSPATARKEREKGGEVDMSLDAIRARRKERMAERERARAQEAEEFRAEMERAKKKEVVTTTTRDKPSAAKKPAVSTDIKSRISRAQGSEKSSVTRFEITAKRSSSKTPDSDQSMSPKPVMSPEPSDKKDDSVEEKVEAQEEKKEEQPKEEEKEEEKPSKKVSVAENEDDVFVPAGEKSESTKEEEEKEETKAEEDKESTSKSPEPPKTSSVSITIRNSTGGSSGPPSQKSSVSSDTEQSAPPRSKTMSAGRSTKSTSVSDSDSSVPAWKKQLLEKKRERGDTVSSPSRKAAASKDSEASLPAWKKELIAKRKSISESKSSEKKTTARSSGTPRSRRKEPAATPDFMKEFQKKKERTAK